MSHPGTPGYPVYAALYRVGVEHPQGTIVLVLGILGFVTGVTGPIAWVMGGRALKEIDASGHVWSNRGTVQAGWVLGIISTVLMAAFVLVMIASLVIWLIMMLAMFAVMTQLG